MLFYASGSSLHNTNVVKLLSCQRNAHTIASCRTNLFSESQRIQYTIQTRTADIQDARTYLLTLKEIRIKYVYQLFFLQLRIFEFFNINSLNVMYILQYLYCLSIVSDVGSLYFPFSAIWISVFSRLLSLKSGLWENLLLSFCMQFFSVIFLTEVWVICS